MLPGGGREPIPPAAVTVLQKAGGTLDEARMIRLNAEAERTKDYSRAADLYFRENGETFATHPPESLAHKVARWTARHLQLAGISLFLPWLPLLPAQILLLNFLSDIPALTIAVSPGASVKSCSIQARKSMPALAAVA